MYQDITETMLGLLGNIFQSIYFCFDNYQVYPLIWSISGYLQVSYLLQQDEYLANITRAGCSAGQCWADCSCSCNDPEHNTGQGHSQGSLRDLGQQPGHHLNNLINISKLGLVFIFTSTGTPNARLDFFLSESPPLKTPLKIIFLARNFLCDLIWVLWRILGGLQKNFLLLFFSKFSKGPPFGYFL